MESCLYEGVVHHERWTPVSHRFQYCLYMAYLDLAELRGLLRAGVLSASRFAPASFWRGDHIGDPRRPLDEAVQTLVQHATGKAAPGPIRVLLQLRTFGYYFSPLTMAYCFHPDGATVAAVVAIVQNTPWRERQAYVLWQGNQERPGAPGRYRHPKTFHVSPFMGMDLEYRWQLRPPGETLEVAIDNVRANEVLFRARLQMRRSPLSRSALRRMQFRYPFMTARILASIYGQAFQLWRKKCPFYPHPKHQPLTPGSSRARAPSASGGSSASAVLA